MSMVTWNRGRAFSHPVESLPLKIKALAARSRTSPATKLYIIMAKTYTELG